MAKTRPGGGRPPGRRGKGGVGPGPGYRAPGTGKGSPIITVVYALAAFVVLTLGGVAAFLLHGYGLLG